MAFFSSFSKFSLSVTRQCSSTLFISGRRPTLVQTGWRTRTRRLFCVDSRIQVQNRYHLVENKISQWCKPFQLARNWSRQYHFTCLHVNRYGNKRQFEVHLFSKRFKGEVPKSENKQGEKKPTVFQRFKAAYKEHGKILIGVHVVTSILWFGLFYVAASEGVDAIPLMERLGFSETIIKPFRNPSLGNLALAYLIYELAKPVRYAATLAGTNIAIKYLRKRGKMAPQQEPFKRLVKDSRTAVTQRLKKRGVTLSQRLKKRRFSLRERTNKISQRMRVQLKDMRRTSRSRWRMTASKLMSQFKRRRATSKK